MQNNSESRDPFLVSISAASRLLSISRWHLYHLVSSGRFPSIKIGRRRLIKMDDIRAIALGKKVVEKIPVRKKGEKKSQGSDVQGIVVGKIKKGGSSSSAKDNNPDGRTGK